MNPFYENHTGKSEGQKPALGTYWIYFHRYFKGQYFKNKLSYVIDFQYEASYWGS